MIIPRDTRSLGGSNQQMLSLSSNDLSSSENMFKKKISKYVTLLCLIVGGSNCKVWGQKPQVHLL